MMKPNTFTKLYIHYVFSPKGRNALMTPSLREEIQKYMYGIIIGKKCFPVAINGTADHLHLLISIVPTISISDLIRDIKRSSALFVNENHFIAGRFAWQEGYGAFTVGYPDLDRVHKYIENQEIHHSKKTFKDEYLDVLISQGIEDSEHMFEFYE